MLLTLFLPSCLLFQARPAPVRRPSRVALDGLWISPLFLIVDNAADGGLEAASTALPTMALIPAENPELNICCRSEAVDTDSSEPLAVLATPLAAILASIPDVSDSPAKG